jgi:hypothetical protein
MKRNKMRYPQPANSESQGGSQRPESGDAPLAEAISVTAEVCGMPLSPAAAEILARDLADFNHAAVLAALARCRMELQRPLKMADILERLDDGHPDVEDAWTMMPRTERESVVWTDEMAQAWGVAVPLLDAGDEAGARNAFRDAYGKALLQARIQRKPARWTPSLGNDVASRESVLLDAVRKRRLTAAHVAQLLPSEVTSSKMQEIFEQVKLKNLH